jgi:hypothetical protein
MTDPREYITLPYRTLLTTVSLHHFLHDCLGHAHGIDGIHRLVGAQAHDTAHCVAQGRLNHVRAAYDVGTHRLHGKELAGRHLLQRSGMKDQIHVLHDRIHRGRITNIANDKAQPGVGLIQPHGFLLLFVATEDTHLAALSGEQVLGHGFAEGTGAAGHQHDTVLQRTRVHRSQSQLNQALV